MSAYLAHRGLPPGVTHFSLAELIGKIAKGTCRRERLSKTAVDVLRHYILGCRPTDFEAGKICGVWEQPQTVADALNISTKVLHDAEAVLRKAGLIERTYSPRARRSGKRHNGDIVALAGMSLRPLIDGYAKWQARREAIELQKNAKLCLKQEVAALNRQIRGSESPELIDQAQEILPGGRVSRIDNSEKLEAIRDALRALLALLELPSSDTRSSHQTEEIVTPNIPESNSSKNCSGARLGTGDDDRATKVTPQMVAGVASSDFRSLLPEGRPPSWHDLVDASATACRWHGISETAFGQACERMGRERAAVCIAVIDRNARLPGEHRYRARSGRKCLAGLLRNPTGLLPMLRAAQGYPEGRLGDGSFTPEPSNHDDRGSFGNLASASLSKLARGNDT